MINRSTNYKEAGFPVMTYTKYYEICDHIIRIDSVHEYIHRMCKEYSSDSTDADLVISTSQEDIDREREYFQADNQYSDGYLETLAAYRKLVAELTDEGFILFHGSALAVNDTGIIFTAPSGTGKSTHARLWRETLGASVHMINDDKPMLHITDDTVEVYGTPWDGKHRLSSNIHVPLRAICIIERSGNNEVEEVLFDRVYPTIIQQTYRSSDVSNLRLTLAAIDKLRDKIKCFIIRCNMEPEAAKVAYEYISEKLEDR